MRADLFLVEHGFATTRSQAQRLIAAGVQWRPEEGAAWKKVAKNGDEIHPGAEVQVLDNTEAKYISRGGLKLEGALKTTGVAVAGLRCLDIGQSTGGFTDCLLQHGASLVVGVDVGHGQLHPTMRSDPRVVCIEGVNARALTADDLAEHYRRALHLKNGGDEDDYEDSLQNANDDEDGEDDYGDDEDSNSNSDSDSDSESGEAGSVADGNEGQDEQDDQDGDESFNPVFDFLTGDLSFISLTLVLPAVVRLLKPDGHLVMLVKPQFELQPGQIGKGGIVREPEHFAFVEKRLRDTCAGLGLKVLSWSESPIQGGDGNREFFIHAQKGQSTGDDKPLIAAPARKLNKRVPRGEMRRSMAPHEDSEMANGPGPSRRKQRDTPPEAD